MSTTIKIDNYGSLNIKETAQLSADAESGQAVLALKSNQGISVNDYAIIGLRGTEPAELKQVLSTSGATGVTMTANLSAKHYKFDPFVTLFGNKIRLYRADNVDGSQPSDASFSLLSTADIDPDQLYTAITDADGGDAYWYKFTYYNSTTSDETNLADSICARGGSANTYCSIDDVREDAGIQNNPYITDSSIAAKIRMAQTEIDSALTGIYTVPFTAPINPLIEKIAIMLASGHILMEQYGPVRSLSNANGKNKLAEARELLRKLDVKELVLTDQNGTDTSIQGSAAGVTGWPNATTESADTSVGGSARAFRTGDRF